MKRLTLKTITVLLTSTIQGANSSSPVYTFDTTTRQAAIREAQEYLDDINVGTGSASSIENKEALEKVLEAATQS